MLQTHQIPRITSYKIWWMMDEMRDRLKAMWSPNQQLTVDEGMIMYKGNYCSIQQYMLCKPMWFSLKVWTTIDALSKYLWNFEVYCGWTGNPHNEEYDDFSSESALQSSGEDNILSSTNDEGRQAMGVVTKKLQDLQGRAHIMTVENFFTSITLSTNLLDKGIMAIGTFRANRNIS
jgi:hypothetical protein